MGDDAASVALLSLPTQSQDFSLNFPVLGFFIPWDAIRAIGLVALLGDHPPPEAWAGSRREE